MSTGSELIFAYGVRAAAGYAFYMTGGPEKVKIIQIVVTLTLSANFEEVVIDSLFSKRLPGDVRAAMKSA